MPRTLAQLSAATKRWWPAVVGLAARNGADGGSVPVGPVAVGLSGGADSLTALVVAIVAGLEPVAVHVDHGLRASSADEAEMVVGMAAELGVQCVVVRPLPGELLMGPNLEARARAARYAALERARVEIGATVVIVGHTADDQAETVLLNLLRGSGPTGLGAMAVRRDAIVRPLLGLRRADTLELCRRLGLAPLHDPMNDDLRYRRVWVRREVLPMLESGAARDLVGVLTRQAEMFRSESEYLDHVALASVPGAGSPMSIQVLVGLEPVIARRAIRLWLGDPVPSFDEVQAVLRVANGEIRAVDLAGGRRVVRHDGRLEVVDSRLVDTAGSLELAFPGTVVGLGVSLEAWVEREAPLRWPLDHLTVVLDADRVGDRGRLRRRPSNGQVLLTSPTGDPLWVVGYRVDRRVEVSEHTRRFLWITAAISTETPTNMANL